MDDFRINRICAIWNPKHDGDDRDLVCCAGDWEACPSDRDFDEDIARKEPISIPEEPRFCTDIHWENQDTSFQFQPPNRISLLEFKDNEHDDYEFGDDEYAAGCEYWRNLAQYETDQELEWASNEVEGTFKIWAFNKIDASNKIGRNFQIRASNGTFKIWASDEIERICRVWASNEFGRNFKIRAPNGNLGKFLASIEIERNFKIWASKEVERIFELWGFNDIERIFQIRIELVYLFLSISACLPFFFWSFYHEWPNDSQRMSACRWPYNMALPVVVLWGVCWMFGIYGDGSSLNSDFGFELGDFGFDFGDCDFSSGSEFDALIPSPLPLFGGQQFGTNDNININETTSSFVPECGIWDKLFHPLVGDEDNLVDVSEYSDQRLGLAQLHPPHHEGALRTQGDTITMRGSDTTPQNRKAALSMAAKLSVLQSKPISSLQDNAHPVSIPQGDCIIGSQDDALLISTSQNKHPRILVRQSKHPSNVKPTEQPNSDARTKTPAPIPSSLPRKRKRKLKSDKVYHCEVHNFETSCDRQFGEHMWKEDKIKYFGCDDCDFRSARKDNLVIHRKSCKGRQQKDENQAVVSKLQGGTKRVSIKNIRNPDVNPEASAPASAIISPPADPTPASRDAEGPAVLRQSQLPGRQIPNPRSISENDAERTKIAPAHDSSKVYELMAKISALEHENTTLKQENSTLKAENLGLDTTRGKLEAIQEELEETKSDRDVWYEQCKMLRKADRMRQKQS
ncbi:hypothetical protein TWF281_000195 [Arthrobotrys megalospora]